MRTLMDTYLFTHKHPHIFLLNICSSICLAKNYLPLWVFLRGSVLLLTLNFKEEADAQLLLSPLAILWALERQAGTWFSATLQIRKHEGVTWVACIMYDGYMGLAVFLCFGSKEITNIIKHLLYCVSWECHLASWYVNVRSDLQEEC